YGVRFFQRSFWHKLARGEVQIGNAIASLGTRVLDAVRPGKPAAITPLPERMQEGLRKFKGPVLLILSGDDLTAKEFRDLVARSPGWQGLLRDSRVTRHEL